jgi:hypothetical protein
MKSFVSSVKAFLGWRAFASQTGDSQQCIAVYSEGKGYWTYFEGVIRALYERHGISVLYATSHIDDPLLVNPPFGMRVFYVGDGTARTLLFASLKVEVMLMTMPDLHSFHIKRSPFPVHYAYLHHSIVSTHMIYRPAAFDHFDTVFCVGPHHVSEIRARESRCGLPAKQLVELGYSRLDRILATSARGPRQRGSSKPTVLVAPTWGERALLELHGERVVASLLDAGLEVVVRPHPRTVQLNKALVRRLVQRFAENPSFTLDGDANAHQSLQASDLMVSDWSGAAFEFCFGLERPVLFVDVPKKVLNPAYWELGIEPLESTARAMVGEVIAESEIAELGTRASAMIAEAAQWQMRIVEARESSVFHVGESDAVAADFLAALLRCQGGTLDHV